MTVFGIKKARFIFDMHIVQGYALDKHVSLFTHLHQKSHVILLLFATL